ncbi:UNVERIFIED_CONTAM: hypothetical protein K2H54_074643 [Gekko kuhli]
MFVYFMSNLLRAKEESLSESAATVVLAKCNVLPRSHAFPLCRDRVHIGTHSSHGKWHTIYIKHLVRCIIILLHGRENFYYSALPELPALHMQPNEVGQSFKAGSCSNGEG